MAAVDHGLGLSLVHRLAVDELGSEPALEIVVVGDVVRWPEMICTFPSRTANCRGSSLRGSPTCQPPSTFWGRSTAVRHRSAPQTGEPRLHPASAGARYRDGPAEGAIVTNMETAFICPYCNNE